MRGRRTLGVIAAASCALALASAPAAAPPPGSGVLVDVARRVPSAVLDLRYATADNFLREPVYACARCLLRREAAGALARAEAAVERRGYRLRLWDCYRPPAVQRRMWRLVPDERYVADPGKGSVHARGGAVDVTLAGPDGRPVEMPTAFDDFSPRAAADAPASAAATRHRELLRAAMEEAGFAVLATEWWHFDLRGSRAWPIVEADPCGAR